MTKSAILVAAALALAACGARPKRATALLDDVRGYHDGIRWEKFAQAAVRLPPPERDAFIEEREALAEDLRIADVELLRVHFVGNGKMRAKVLVRYTWLLDSRGIVHKTWAHEVWARRGKRWMIEKNQRSRGEPMPGLEEPPEAAEPAAARR